MALAQLLGRRDQIVDNLGNPLAGGLVNIYEPNTTNRVTSYTASDIVVANPNPVKLSGSGRANIWVTRNVDVRITDKDGNLVVEELSVNPDDLGGVFDSGLIPNGSFETDADADDVPDGWDLENEGAGANNGLENTESTDGGLSWRSQSAGSGGGELVTTDFFPVNDVDDLRVNFDLRSTVATVRNIVRVEWYDISQVSISNTDVYDSTANPATFTSQVLTATPPAGARFAKLRILGGTTGGILAGITYWDRFQVFYPQVVSGVFDNLTISGNDIISTNTNGDINLTPNGTGDTVVKNLEALTQAQLGFAGEVTLDVGAANDVRIRADITTATPPVAEAVTAGLAFYDSDGSDQLGNLGYIAANLLELRNFMHGGAVRLSGEDAAGTLRTLLNADPDGAFQAYHAGVLKMQSSVTGPLFIADIVTASPPTTEGVNAGFKFFDLDVSDELGRVGMFGNNTLLIKNFMHGALVELQGERVSDGATRTLLSADPDGEVDLYSALNNVIALRTGTGGVEIRSVASVDTEDRLLLLAHQDGTRRAAIGHFAAAGAILDVRNEIEGGGLSLSAEQAGGAVRVGFDFDPDTLAQIYHPANNTVALRTADETAADASSAAEVRGPDDVFHGIGYNLLPRVAISGGNRTLSIVDQGLTLFYNEATARTITFNNDGNIPIDAFGHIRVGDDGGTLTLDAGAGVVFVYWNGSGYVAHTAAANLELTDGSYTWWKNSDTEFFIDGPNITAV